MRYVFVFLALCGIFVSSMALREHFNTGAAPCDLNATWNCSTVNKSEFAVVSGILGMGDGKSYEGEPEPSAAAKLLGKIPISVVGIFGYLLMGVLGWLRRYKLLLAPALFAFAFSAYLTHHIEAHVLEAYCIYCVISYGLIILFTINNLGVVIRDFIVSKKTAATPVEEQ